MNFEENQSTSAINQSIAAEESSVVSKKKMSPRTADKVKILAQKKVRLMRQDTVMDDDGDCMERLTKMLKLMRNDNAEINYQIDSNKNEEKSAKKSNFARASNRGDSESRND
jgi:hypothetical protein